jgi:hypothetical protein
MTRKPCRAQAPAAKGLRAGAALAYSGRWALCAVALCRPAVVPGAPDRGARCTRRAGRTDAGHGPALQPPPAAALLSGWQQPTVSLDCLQCISSQPMVHLVPSLHTKSESLTACLPSAIVYIWQVGADESTTELALQVCVQDADGFQIRVTAPLPAHMRKAIRMLFRDLPEDLDAGKTQLSLGFMNRHCHAVPHQQAL